MKFLIQKIDKRVRHDFSFVLLEAIEFRNWFDTIKSPKIKVKYFNTTFEQKVFVFESVHRDYTPIGSVEFVSAYLQHFYGLTPKPLNVPEELFKYAERGIYNGTEKDFPKYKKFFAKSNTGIKKFAEIVEDGNKLKPDNYQFSEYINIDSEWRAFIYENKLVGLQNYAGEFTKFPNVNRIKDMIEAYKSAPVAYTLDIGVNDNDGYASHVGTFVIECHSFFSNGLYGFANLAILPNMFHKWFREYLNKNL